MPDSVLGKIAVEIGGGTAANGGGGGSPSSTSISGGGGDAEVKKQSALLGGMREHLGKITKNSDGEPRFWTKAFKTMGIQVGLAGILKQSQVFTSTLGSLFQILGAFVDVILAPWLPLIMPLMRNLANKIPWFKKKSEQAYKWMTETFVPWLMKVGGAVKKVITTAWAGIKGFLDVVFNSEKWGPTITKGMEAVSKWWKGIEWTSLLKTLWDGAIEMLKKFWDSTLGGKEFMGFKFHDFGTKGGAKDDKAGQRGSEDEQRGTDSSIQDARLKRFRDKNPLEQAIHVKDTAVETFENAVETFANMDFAKQVGTGYGAAMAARYAATPLKVVAKAVSPGLMGPIIDIAADAMKKPHQLMNFLAKNTGKAMLATFGKITGSGAGTAASTSTDAIQRLHDMGLDDNEIADLGKKKNPLSRATRTFGKFGQGVVNAGQEVGDAIGSKTPKAVNVAAQKISSGLRTAGNTAKNMMEWLQGIMTGKIKNVTESMANGKIKNLWKAFGPLIAENGAMRAAPLLLTRIARYLVPGAALAFVIGETKYDIGKMLESDTPWLRDINKETLAAEGKVWAGASAMQGGADSFGANALSGLIPQAMDKLGLGGDGGEGAAERMKQSMAIYHGGQNLMEENYGNAVFTGTKSQIIGGRLAAALMEGGGSMFGPAGLPVALGGLALAEGTRQQSGIGIGSGQDYFSSGQFKQDLSFLSGGVYKVSVDGQSGEAYLASE